MRKYNNSTILMLRWMPLCFCIIFLHMIATVNSGPVYKRMIAGDQTNNNTKALDASCLIDGNHVPKSSITCEKKSGCRAIQRTGECCPEYQCECEKNGKIYGNGEKLETETPCRVCYCQGGEILCNPVTCYIRNDCKPKHIVGRCCPEYDNCPTLEQLLASQSSKETELSNEVKENVLSSTSTVTTIIMEEKTTPSPNNPSGIKIKEITKPEEIKIYKLKFSTEINPSRTQTTQQVDNIEETSIKNSFTSDNYNNNNNNDSNDVKLRNEPVSIEDLHKLDNNELIGDRTDNFKNVRHATDHFEGTSIIINDELTSSSAVQSDDGPTTSPIDISSSTQTLNLIKNQLAPSVLHIGDKVLILDHNGPSPITVIGVEGLQRGEEPDDNTEDYEAKIDKILPNNHDDLELIPSITNGLIDVNNTDLFETTFNARNETEFNNTSYNFNDDETEGRYLNNSEIGHDEKNSSRINDDLDFQMSLDENQNSTDFNDTQIESSSPPTDSKQLQGEDDHIASSSDNIQVLSTSSFEELSSRIPMSADNETTNEFSSESSIRSPTTETIKIDHLSDDITSSSQKTYVEDDETPTHELINPGHASIPEDVSIFGRDQELTAQDTEDEKDKTFVKSKYEIPSKILPEVAVYRSNLTQQQLYDKGSLEIKESTSTIPPEWLKGNTKLEITSEQPNSSNLQTEQLLELNKFNEAHFRSASLNWETSTTDRNNNETDITTKSSQIIHNVSMHLGNISDELEDGSGSGSGNGSGSGSGDDKLQINPSSVRIDESIEGSSDLDVNSFIIDDLHTTNNGS